MNENVTDKQAYIRFWTNLLFATKGWNEDEVINWARKFKSRIDDPDGLFFHETATYYAIPEIVPPGLLDRLSRKELSKFICDFEQVVYQYPNGDRNEYAEDFDFSAAAERIKQFIDTMKV